MEGLHGFGRVVGSSDSLAFNALGGAGSLVAATMTLDHSQVTVSEADAR